jgi:hypothetical protein
MILPWSPILPTAEGIFEYQRIVQGSNIRENNTPHVMDNQSRIAVARVGAPFPDDTTPAVKYHLGDHLGGSSLVLDDTGALVNREEYTPYGDTGFGSFARKHCRFTGKECDEESGRSPKTSCSLLPMLAAPRPVHCKSMQGRQNRCNRTIDAHLRVQ